MDNARQARAKQPLKTLARHNAPTIGEPKGLFARRPMTGGPPKECDLSDRLADQQYHF